MTIGSDTRAVATTSSRVRVHADGADGARGATERELLARYHDTREPEVLDVLVQGLTPLARSLAMRYRHGPEHFEDLMQVASIGLVNAIKRFDPDRGAQFSSFAVPTILGELRRHFRTTGWAVHVKRSLQERSATVERMTETLTRRLGRSPSVNEIAANLDLTAEEVLEAMEVENGRSALSMDAGGSPDSDEAPPIAESFGDEDPGYDAVEYGTAIAPVLDELSERDREIVRLRFVDDLTQSEIGSRLGITQMQVSRILRATVERLREEAREDGG